MSTNTRSLSTSLVPPQKLTAGHDSERQRPEANTNSPSLTRGITLMAVVPEWALRALMGHLKQAINLVISELDRLDIQLRLDVHRAPRTSSRDSDPVEMLERRTLELLAELHQRRQA
jgi:hypothetical protein